MGIHFRTKCDPASIGYGVDLIFGWSTLAWNVLYCINVLLKWYKSRMCQANPPLNQITYWKNVPIAMGYTNIIHPVSHVSMDQISLWISMMHVPKKMCIPRAWSICWHPWKMRKHPWYWYWIKHISTAKLTRALRIEHSKKEGLSSYPQLMAGSSC